MEENKENVAEEATQETTEQVEETKKPNINEDGDYVVNLDKPIENETKEDAEYIATDQNCSPRFKCTLWNSTESDVEEEEVVSKEVSFELDEDQKGYWKDVKND